MDLPDVKALISKPPALAVLLGTLILFLIANWLLRNSPSLSFVPTLIALLVVVELFAYVGLEVKEGAQAHGWKHEVLDTLIALVVAVAAWYAISFLLNTSSPISAVVSCSMLPNLQRGDFVIVQGAPVSAYSINMTPAELASLSGPATIFYDGTNVIMQGSLYSYCVNYNASVCDAFEQDPAAVVEQKGAFTYHYAACPISLSNGTSFLEPCLTTVTFDGQDYLTNFSNDIIVYQPPAGDVYASVGAIVHRVMFKINVDGEEYYLTRGDNNPILDLQVYDYSSGQSNHPIPQDDVQGKVIARVPLVGYFKLFLVGSLQEDPQCKSQLTFDHV
jgi:signal peptidase I